MIQSCAHLAVPYSSAVGRGIVLSPCVTLWWLLLILYDSLISELYFRESPNLLFIVSLKIDTWNFKADSISLSLIINSSIFTIFSMHWNIIFTSFVGLGEIDLQKILCSFKKLCVLYVKQHSILKHLKFICRFWKEKTVK